MTKAYTQPMLFSKSLIAVSFCPCPVSLYRGYVSVGPFSSGKASSLLRTEGHPPGGRTGYKCHRSWHRSRRTGEKYGRYGQEVAKSPNIPGAARGENRIP